VQCNRTTHQFSISKVFGHIKKIEINRSSGGKVNKRRSTSSLNMSNNRLFKDLLEFVGRCTQLEVLTFEQVDFEMSVVFSLCKALITTTSRKFPCIDYS
jgi:hypothetical protein